MKKENLRSWFPARIAAATLCLLIQPLPMISWRSAKDRNAMAWLKKYWFITLFMVIVCAAFVYKML